MIAPVRQSAPTSPETVTVDASTVIGSWPKVGPGPFNVARLEAAVDALRSPDRTGWPELAGRVREQLGVGVKAAEEIVERLAAFVKLPPELGSQLEAAAPKKKCDYDTIEEKFTSLVASTVAEEPGDFKSRLRTGLIMEEGLRFLQGPSPRGYELNLPDAQHELLSHSKLGQHALEVGRRRIDKLGRSTGWHPAKLLDLVYDRYERPSRVVGAMDSTVSLDRMLRGGDPKHIRTVLPYDRDQRIACHIPNTARQQLSAERKAKVRVKAETRSRAWRPSGLTRALQAYIRSEKPLEELCAADIEDHIDLGAGSTKIARVVRIRNALRFKAALRRFLELEGHGAQEVEAILQEVEEAHDRFLRAELVHRVTGIDNLVPYRSTCKRADERRRLLQRLVLGTYGYFRGHDLMAVVDAPDADHVETPAEPELVSA